MTTPDGSATPGRRVRRGHGRPTLHEVSVAAGVTRITVSRFLREPDLVSTGTAARIRRAIADTGYVPNRQAGQLASGRSRIVVALIPNVGHSIFAETIQGLADGLHGSGLELMVAATGYSAEREAQQLRALLGWSPAAIIVTGRRRQAEAVAMLSAVQRAGTPVIEIWDRAPEDAAPADDAGFAQIGFSHHAVGRAMAMHLLERGHRRLAYVDSGVAEDFRAHDRGEGFAACARAAGASVTVLQAAAVEVYDAGRALLARLRGEGGAPVSAAAFANDAVACGTLMEAIERGVAVPCELALLGFGDLPIGRQLRPALSSVRPPRREIGLAAAQALRQSLARDEPPAGCDLGWTIVERASTAGIARTPGTAGTASAAGT